MHIWINVSKRRRLQLQGACICICVCVWGGAHREGLGGVGVARGISRGGS